MRSSMSALSVCGKPVARDMTIGLSGIEPRRWKIRTVRRIRIMLRLQAQRIELAMGAAVFADHAAVEEIAGIELHAGLIGPQFHGAPGRGIFDPRRQPRWPGHTAA